MSVSGSQSTSALLCLTTPSVCHCLIQSFVCKNWRTSNPSAWKLRYFITFPILFHVWFLLGNWVYLACWTLECLVMPFLCSRWQRTYLLLWLYTFSLSETLETFITFILWLVVGHWSVLWSALCKLPSEFRLVLCILDFSCRVEKSIVLSQNFHFLLKEAPFYNW